MSIYFSHSEAHPGRDCPLSQLLHATKRKLWDITSGGRISMTLGPIEVDALEQHASEVLSIVRSLKNSLAPIDRIPPEVISLIPDHSGKDDPGELLITLTQLSSVTRISLGTAVLETEMSELREHVTQVDCKVSILPFSWEHLPDE